MKIVGRRPGVFLFLLALAGAGALWASSLPGSRPMERLTLPLEEETITCDAEEFTEKVVEFTGLGTFSLASLESNTLVARIGKSFISKRGLKTVPLQVLANGGRSFAEGLGEARFWLDASRPVTSAIWEKRAGTEFPAIQEMRFHFFYTVEALPGRIFRSVTPARMRSDNVRAFPPPPGTFYRMMNQVDLEDVAEPGVVVGRVLANKLVIPPPKPPKILPWVE